MDDCDRICDDCLAFELFGCCPYGAIDQDVIEIALDAYDRGRESVIEHAERCLDHADSCLGMASRAVGLLNRRTGETKE